MIRFLLDAVVYRLEIDKEDLLEPKAPHRSLQDLKHFQRKCFRNPKDLLEPKAPRQNPEDLKYFQRKCFRNPKDILESGAPRRSLYDLFKITSNFEKN